jgi:acetyltransferase-like isoleucine patch superfamily enzyme
LRRDSCIRRFEDDDVIRVDILFVDDLHAELSVKFCIINTMASVDHDCVLEPFASIAPGAHLGGNVHVGARTFIGMSATIIHSVHIGHDTVIGAGATVVKDIPNHVVAYGSPAKPIRGRVMNERYL